MILFPRRHRIEAANLPPVATAPAPAAAVPAPPPLPRATYRVTFDGAIPDLTVHQATRPELAAAVVEHVRPYVPASSAVVDRQMPFVLVRHADHTTARGTFVTLPTGGAR